MRILILFTVIFSFGTSLTCYSFDLSKMQDELQEIQENFLSTTPEKTPTKKIEKKLKRREETTEVKNLEAIYFDNISTKNAAPIRKKKKKVRSR